MSQATLSKPDHFADLPDPALSNYLRNAGELLADEAALLKAVTGEILAAQGHLTHKAIILRLIQELECTRDVVKADVIRKALEIIVDHTMDDL